MLFFFGNNDDDKVIAYYNYSPFSSTESGTPFFRFIYAEGSK